MEAFNSLAYITAVRLVIGLAVILAQVAPISGLMPGDTGENVILTNNSAH